MLTSQNPLPMVAKGLQTMDRPKDKILVVDDAADNLRLLMNMLSVQYDVQLAANGEEALLAVETQPPDLILLDVMMPDMDGFTVCKKLKASQKTQHIPIIFLTVLDNLVGKIEAFAAGGVDYITKPFQVKEVLARVETHLTIAHLQKRLEMQIAELDAFAHTVAHDLKSPLWLITSFAEILLTEFAGEMSAEMQELVQNIEESGHKGIRIIEALLLLASVQRQEVPLTPVDMVAVVNRAIERLQQHFPQTRPQILLPDEWPQVVGYEPWLEEVWVNYLSNAFKYSGDSPQISCGMTLMSDNRVKFWVQDNGPGISLVDQEKLFTEFNQLEPARQKGYGLGLSIVHRIVSRLGGEVGIESQLGQGSQFYFILPVNAA